MIFGGLNELDYMLWIWGNEYYSGESGGDSAI